MKKIIIITLFFLLYLTKMNSQNHYFGISVGYTTSSATAPDGNFLISSDGLSQGQDFYDFKSGFQIGLQANIDIGNDFYHLELAPQFSQYGFGNQTKISLNYLDFDIGGSNFNSEVYSKFAFGGGITPSFLISSENIEEINDFDLKVYLKLGYRFSGRFVFYSQVRYSFLELVPDSKVKNLQISFNLNYTIFKI